MNMNINSNQIVRSFKHTGNKIKTTYQKVSITNRLKVLIIILLIPVIIFSTFPLVSASAEVALKGGIGNNTKSVEIVSPDNDITTVTATDILSNKNIEDYSIYGKRIGDISLFGASLYDIVTMPVPDYGIIGKLSDFLNGNGVQVLQNEDVKSFLRNNLGEVGTNICNLMDIANQYVDQAKTIVSDAQTIYDAINNASNSIRGTINSINTYKLYACIGFYILPVLLLVGIILLLIKRKPNFTPAIILSVLTFLLLAIGIGIICANSFIGSQMNQVSGDLNSIITGLIASYIPNLSSTLSMLGISTNVFLGVYLHCNYGYYLLLLTSAIITAVAYIIPVYSNRHQASQNI